MMSKLKKLVLPLVVAALVTSGAYAAATDPDAKEEIHGKPPVKLTERVTFPVQDSGKGSPITWSPDGSFLAFYKGAFESTGHELSQFHSSTDGFEDNLYEIRTLCFVNGSEDIIYPAESRGTVAKQDGRLVVVSKEDDVLDVRDVKTGSVVKKIEGDMATLFTISPDQKYLATISPHKGMGKIAIYDTKDWHVLTVADIGPRESIASLTFFPDGKRMAAGTLDGRIKIIDVFSGKTVKDFDVYTSKFGDVWISQIALSPRGDFIMTAKSGGDINGKYINLPEAQTWGKSVEVSIWRVNDGVRVDSFALSGLDPINQVVWDPKGRFAAFTDHAQNLILWQPTVKGGNFISVNYSASQTSKSFSPMLAISQDGKSLAVTRDDKITIYNIEDN